LLKQYVSRLSRFVNLRWVPFNLSTCDGTYRPLAYVTSLHIALRSDHFGRIVLLRGVAVLFDYHTETGELAER
jgi:hypothetical protein